VLADSTEVLAGGRVPEASALVIARGGQQLAVGGEDDLANEAAASFQAADFLATRRVPESDHLVATRRGRPQPVRGKRDGADPLVVTGDDAVILAQLERTRRRLRFFSGQG